MENVNKKTREELLEIAKQVKEDQIGGIREPEQKSEDRLTTQPS